MQTLVVALAFCIMSCANEADLKGSNRSVSKDDHRQKVSFDNDGTAKLPSIQINNEADNQLDPNNNTSGAITPNNDASSSNPPLSDNTKLSRIRVGFNYEDTPNADQDFNDGVLCIEGSYAVDFESGIIRSLQDQRVTLQFRDGGLHQNRIYIKKYFGAPTNPNSVAEVYRFEGKNGGTTQTESISYTFKKGENISISYNSNQPNFAAVPLSLGGSKELILIEVDKCRLSGE